MTSLYQRYVARWKNCRRCLLCSQRRRIVLARGRVPAPILFVGEAPGSSEDVLGRPFVGPAGHLLDSIIGQALDGQYDYALTNLVACYPREAKAVGVNEPPSEAIEACQPRLAEFIGICRPQVIVCVGDLASKNLKLPSRGQGPTVVGITHPAAILRMNVAQRGLVVQRCIVTIEEAASEIE